MLPLTQRQVITLVDLEGCSYAEVTEILDIPLGTVMSRLSRARKMLKEQLMYVRNIKTSPSHLRRVK
jgi:RNA polymerase sigma-70 factor (ECF subfamily)